MQPQPNATREQALNNACNELARSGLVELSANGPIATRRWRAALARAALELLKQQADDSDPRLPVALALYGIYGEDTSIENMVAKIEIMLRVQQTEFERLRARIDVDRP